MLWQSQQIYQDKEYMYMYKAGMFLVEILRVYKLTSKYNQFWGAKMIRHVILQTKKNPL
jgi:hypothetical protein